MKFLSKGALAECGLVLATMLWGLTFPVIRIGVTGFDARYFVAIRFAIASLGFAILLVFLKVSRAHLREAIIPGLVTGAIVSLTYIFQTIGLETVSSPRAAFLTAAYVVFVPLFSPFFGRGRPRLFDLGASAVAIFGLYLIMDPQLGGVSEGDIWVLGCAFVSAIAIHSIGIVASRPLNLQALAFWQVVGVAIVSAFSLLTASEPKLHFSGSVWGAILICAFVVTIGAFLLQTNCQKFLSPERSALIYSLEPIFAIFFGLLILDEKLSPKGLLGGALIILAVGAERIFLSLRRSWLLMRGKATAPHTRCPIPK